MIKVIVGVLVAGLIGVVGNITDNPTIDNNIVPIEQVQDEEVKEVMGILEENAEKYFDRYELGANGDTITLVYHVDRKDVEELIQFDNWEEYTEGFKDMAISLSDKVNENYKNIELNFHIVDLDRNEFYYSVKDGKVTYDYSKDFVSQSMNK